MMVFMHVVFGISCIPIWPILFFTMRNLAKPKKNIIIGVTLPHSVHDDAAVQRLTGRFRMWMNISMLPLLPLLFPVLFLSGVGAVMTWYMTWITLIVVVPNVVFAIYREKLMALKRDNAWYGEAAGMTIADVKAAAEPPRKVSWIWFLIPLLISVIPIAHAFVEEPAWGMNFAIVYITNTALIALFWLLYYLIFRVRAEVVNENLPLTMALTRMRRYKWGKLWLIATWLTCGFNILTWAFSGSITAFIVVTLCYVVLVLIAAIYIEFSTRFAQQNLTSGDSGEKFADEDEHWIWGLFYHNRHDNNFIINNRIGINMSFNLAKPAAKAIMLVGALLLVAMPFFGVWMWVQEATPARLVLTQTELIARHTSDRYVISLDSIESVELIERLPYTNYKINGADYNNLSIGVYSVIGVGRSEFFVHPKSPPILYIVSGGRHYFLNDADASVTQDVYLALTG